MGPINFKAANAVHALSVESPYYSRAVYAASVVALVSYYYTTSALVLPHLEAFEARRQARKGLPLKSGGPKAGGKTEQQQKRSTTRKRKSWLVTNLASACMTVASMPFVIDLIRGGWDVAKLERRRALGDGASAFFVAYLSVDLVLGFLHYKEHIALLTGWIHHTAYIALVTLLIRTNLGSVFAMAAFMELPTFILSLAVIVPATRSDELFNALFFLIRIVFHAALICLYGSANGRVNGTFGNSGVTACIPLFSLLAAAPLHVSWFMGSMQGYLKRRKASSRRSSVAPVAPPAPAPATVAPTKEPRSRAATMSYAEFREAEREASAILDALSRAAPKAAVASAYNVVVRPTTARRALSPISNRGNLPAASPFIMRAGNGLKEGGFAIRERLNRVTGMMGQQNGGMVRAMG